MNILIGIKSCWKHRERRDACRTTWAKIYFWPYKFFVGAHKPTKPFGSALSNLTGEEDLEICPTPDDFKNIGPKVQCICTWAVHHEASHLIVADDDTYWRPERALELIDRMDKIGADVAAFMRVEPIYPQGSFYILKPKAFAEIAASAIMQETGPDDVLVGRVLTSRDVVWHHAEEIHVGPWWPQKHPQNGNGIISTHKCLPGEMQHAHELWKASYGVS